MDVRQLRYFLSVAKCRSFSRAGVELNIAQPALSHHVANLEAELGVKLFERSTKGVTPTECGETLMRHAETILRQVTKAAIDVKITSAQPSGTVSIGLPTSISIGLTVPLLHAVEARYPAITLKIIENHSGFLSEWILAGRLDMGVLFDIDPASPFDLKPLMEEHLYFVAAPGSFIDGRESIELNEISGTPLILTGASHGLRHAIDRHENGIAFDVKTEIDSLVAIKQLVASGYGHSILPWGAIQGECAAGVLHAVRIEKPKIKRKVYLASARGWPRSRAAEIISGLLFEVAGGLVADDRWRGELLKESGI
ncbi:LysR substrate-binding domain-containing protein [Aquamicrobium sp. NLF2-7]|uniref:LysR family transcriptional regulator n=1 Tax=Aquamicrobium sp. NLF2-7 TaxID=2918753 RepID=UPI001EFAE44D|nr:LysR substrate-binding domain-containing protein [Aquamicrobium sp. NLF2-7]MCG8274573.1 LysR substrate-binding domain-containing protein [Aquamicrobium sp. NLF2-7]